MIYKFIKKVTVNGRNGHNQPTNECSSTQINKKQTIFWQNTIKKNTKKTKLIIVVGITKIA